MILLQANMFPGAFILVIFGVFLLFGIPVLTGISMKILWRVSGKIHYIKENIPYHKDPIRFFPSLLYSIVTLSVIYYKLIVLVDILV